MTIKRPLAKVLRVHVTQETIDRAIPKESTVCMIAEAIKLAFDGASNVSVDMQTCRVTDKKRGLRYIYVTPRAAGLALLQFDAGIKPEPFSMILKNGRVLNANKKKKHKGLERVSLRRMKGDDVIPVGGREPPRIGKGLSALKRRRVFGVRLPSGPIGKQLLEAEALSQSRVDDKQVP